MRFQAWLDEIGRRIIGQRAAAEQPRGVRHEVLPAIRQFDSLGNPHREEGRFDDQTGVSLIGEGTISVMTT